MSRLGSSFIGSSDLQTSTSNMEIIPINTDAYKFSFVNDQICHVKINGKNPIYLRALQGFESDETDKEIRSFIIVEVNITFNFIGAI